MNKIKLAKIVAALTTDGHLQLDDTRGTISFYTKDKDEIIRFNSLFREVFGKGGNIFEDKWDGNIRYKLFISSRKIAIKLKVLGTPAGNKTNTKFVIPNWVINGTLEVKRTYLRTLFDCEGSIFLQSDGRWRLTYTMHKNRDLIEDGIKFMESIRDLLLEHSIVTSRVRVSKGIIRKDGSLSLNMKIEVKRSSLCGFKDYIGFDNLVKQEKLLQALDI